MLKNIYNLFLKEKFKYFNNKASPGFWTPKNSITDYEIIYIDLRNINHAHLGDQIFFISSFLNTNNKEKVIFLINKNLKDFYSCFDVNYITDLPKEFIKNSILLTSIKSYIFPTDSIANKFNKVVCYDLTDSEIKKPLYSHIHDSFFKNSSIKVSDKINNYITHNENFFNTHGIKASRYYIFNDILYSRSFLRLFLQKSITKKIKKLKEDNSSIIYVGSKDDIRFKSSSIHYVDYDLRGKLTFHELNKLISSDRCIGYIRFDNAIMHLCLLFNKKSYVKFRGRFSKSAYDLHIRSINCAVNDSAKNNIEYI